MVIDIGSSKKKRVNGATPKKLLIFLLNFILCSFKGFTEKIQIVTLSRFYQWSFTVAISLPKQWGLKRQA